MLLLIFGLLGIFVGVPVAVILLYYLVITFMGAPLPRKDGT